MAIGLLSDLLPGEGCVVKCIQIDGPAQSRLFDMGFRKGANVQCAYIAPSGSPMAFWIKDSLVAMRRCDCRMISVMLGG